MARSRTVAYLQYANPAAYPPLQHSAGILAEAGWRVVVLGIVLADVARLRFSDDPRIVVKLRGAATAGWRRKLHYLSFGVWALLQVVRARASWIYASDPLVAPVAWLATFLPGVRVIYHEHDTPDEGAASGFLRSILGYRRRLLEHAAVVVVPNEERGHTLAATSSRRLPLVCVWNCPRAREAIAGLPAEAASDFWIVYQGSIVPNRVPRTVVEALGELPDRVKLRIIGYETAGHRGYVDDLRALANSVGAGGRVEWIQPTPRVELLASTARCSLGLSLMPMEPSDVNERHMTGASNKAFEYLACGVPLLVSDLPDWRRTFVEPGYGRACRPDDARSIAHAVAWFLSHRDAARAMGERGRLAVATTWNYERQFEPVLAIMSQS